MAPPGEASQSSEPGCWKFMIFTAALLLQVNFDVELVKHGLELLSEDDLSTAYILSNLRKYFKLSDHWYFASGITAKYSSNDRQPYFLQSALGFNRDFVRGYEYYVIDGQDFFLIKNNI